MCTVELYCKLFFLVLISPEQQPFFFLHKIGQKNTIDKKKKKKPRNETKRIDAGNLALTKSTFEVFLSENRVILRGKMDLTKYTLNQLVELLVMNRK